MDFCLASNMATLTLNAAYSTASSTAILDPYYKRNGVWAIQRCDPNLGVVRHFESCSMD